jgi:hypothetical protein
VKSTETSRTQPESSPKNRNLENAGNGEKTLGNRQGINGSFEKSIGE